MQTIPKQITTDQLSEAMTAFFDVLGVNPKATYFPLHVDGKTVTFPAVPLGTSMVDGSEGMPEGVRDLEHPQGHEFGELASMIEIQVVDAASIEDEPA